MRNKVIAAMKTKLKTISDLSILGPEYAVILDSRDENLFRLLINQLPAVCIDYRSEKRERKGSSFAKTFRGRIIVAVMNIDLEKAYEDIATYVSGDGYVLDSLYEIPTPEVEGTNLRLTIHESHPEDFSATDGNEFYITEVIPCDIEIWK